MGKEMKYIEFVDVYEKLGATAGRLDKTEILASFMKKLEKEGKAEWGYLLYGKVVPDYDAREFGISRQLAFKAISKAFGINEKKVIEEFNKIGDLGEIAEKFADKRKQSALFSKALTVAKVFDNLQKAMVIEGKGAVDRKMALTSELLGQASGKEAKYIIRTLLNDLRIGVQEGVVRDALVSAFFKEKEGMAEKVEDAYGMVNDFAVVFEACAKGEKELGKIEVMVGRPMKVMLAVKAESVEEAFEICGKPAAFEYKYDGFRLVINKKGKEIKLFTRRLEDVTAQFPDVVAAVRENVKGESFILDSEAVGFDKKTGKYKPFEAISQRIKRKYDINKLIKELPVEVNVFDVMYLNGENLMDKPYTERRKILEKVIKEERWKIRTSEQKVIDSEKDAEKFYHDALKAGEEGVMIKRIDAPYKQARRVGYMAKLKPAVADLDLVIVGAEYGSGKRAGWLTSYIVACLSDGKFLEVGKVSSGLKELEGEGEGDTTHEEMTKMLKPLIIGKKGNTVEAEPKIVVSVTYQNIQGSPSYNSGFAMRFPRITHYRPDKRVGEIATLEDIEREVKRGQRR
ncbi:MAG: ATP-dependent DNA ligase [Candidatus Nanoarchaeia archaeon]|nr:ATP-dependent DNA ligase [Candidatus Nanoarchaeia archaeon]